MARPALRSDPAYKRLFSHARMVADLIRLLDAPWVDELDLRRLERLPAEHVADDLRKRLADMPWWVPFKPGGGRPAGAGVLLQIEFQLAPEPHMAERLLEYAALLRRDLSRSGWMSAAGGRSVLHVPLVVYSGRKKWNAPRQLIEDVGWVPVELVPAQPRIAYWLLDSKDYAGDDAADGNLARATLALDGAAPAWLAAAFRRAAALVVETRDAELWYSFEAWCAGVLRPRLGDALRDLANTEEAPMSLLAETLRKWDERNFAEGRREGRQEGLLEGQRKGLCSLAVRRFGDVTGTELAGILAGVEDDAELARVGTLIIDCDTGEDFLGRVRQR